MVDGVGGEELLLGSSTGATRGAPLVPQHTVSRPSREEPNLEEATRVYSGESRGRLVIVFQFSDNGVQGMQCCDAFPVEMGLPGHDRRSTLLPHAGPASRSPTT